ncbi:zinc ribbon domain-containing protein [Streptomyces sp. NPDC005529]|uniref:zinc ribbon domain-containing protein n=1 Tax=unclassified Streptomyces TaxID=2593676 RepID=UPI0036B6B427
MPDGHRSSACSRTRHNGRDGPWSGVGRFTPTSQTCSACGVKDGPKPLDVREWICSACGAGHDRDHNAALNAKTAAGLVESACRAPVRPGAISAQCEESWKPRVPDRTPCRVAAQHRSRRAEPSGFSVRSKSSIDGDYPLQVQGRESNTGPVEVDPHRLNLSTRGSCARPPVARCPVRAVGRLH